MTYNLNRISMKYKNSTEAILALMQDAQKFHEEEKFEKPLVSFESDHAIAGYEVPTILTHIPEHLGTNWRLYAVGGVLQFSINYYYEEEWA